MLTNLSLGIGLIELGIGLRINNGRRTVLARVSGLVIKSSSTDGDCQEVEERSNE